jgi:hypothetical protein
MEITNISSLRTISHWTKIPNCNPLIKKHFYNKSHLRNICRKWRLLWFVMSRLNTVASKSGLRAKTRKLFNTERTRQWDTYNETPHQLQCRNKENQTILMEEVLLGDQ